MDQPPSEAARTAAHLARNAVDSLPAGALADRLATGRPLRVKLGLDPTASDLHLGHTVVLQKLREFQDAGHTVVLIIGDFTARVGDPSGRSATRPLLSGEEIDAHARTYVEQAAKVLRTDDEAVFELRHNGEWLDMKTEDLFRLARVPTVAQILERDDFARRMAASEPVSLLELLYPVLQGYDSVAVRSDVELGGTDQTFNLLMGRSIQTAYGQPPQSVLTVPLLVGTDGAQKMSKSLGNQIGITEPPADMYGKTLSVPDAVLGSWYDLLLGSAPPAELSPRDAKHALARALVERFHGPAAAQEAAAALRAGLRLARAAVRRRGGRGAGLRPRRAPAGADRVRVRRVAVGGAAGDLGRRREARRRAGRAGRARRAGRRARRARAAGRQAALPAPARGVTVHTGLLRLETEGDGQIVDLTEGVLAVVRQSGVTAGVVCVFVTGSTVAVTTMEFEPGGVADLQAALERLVPAGGEYQHNLLNADDNAHAHLRASLIGPSETVPLVAGRLVLGTWQQLVLIDFDDRPRRREIHVQVVS